MYHTYIPFTATRALNLSFPVRKSLTQQYEAGLLTLASFENALKVAKHLLCTKLNEFKYHVR